jgi:acetyltransferase-like isoleucine patch superfamily enzyme
MTPSSIEKILSFLNMTRALLFTRLIAPAFYSAPKGCLIVPPFRFGDLKLVRLGAHVTIHDHSWLLTVANTGHETSPKLVIGDGTIIGSHATIAAAKSVVIGNHVLFAGYVYVSDHGHAYEDIARPVIDQGIRKISEVSIGDDSWIGQNAMILPGSVIGKHCIVGANSVVNSVVPDFSVVAGNPARVIRKFNSDKGIWENVSIHQG